MVKENHIKRDSVACSLVLLWKKQSLCEGELYLFFSHPPSLHLHYWKKMSFTYHSALYIFFQLVNMNLCSIILAFMWNFKYAFGSGGVFDLCSRQNLHHMLSFLRFLHLSLALRGMKSHCFLQTDPFGQIDEFLSQHLVFALCSVHQQTKMPHTSKNR